MSGVEVCWLRQRLVPLKSTPAPFAMFSVDGHVHAGTVRVRDALGLAPRVCAGRPRVLQCDHVVDLDELRGGGAAFEVHARARVRVCEPAGRDPALPVLGYVGQIAFQNQVACGRTPAHAGRVRPSAELAFPVVAGDMGFRHADLVQTAQGQRDILVRGCRRGLAAGVRRGLAGSLAGRGLGAPPAFGWRAAGQRLPPLFGRLRVRVASGLRARCRLEARVRVPDARDPAQRAPSAGGDEHDHAYADEQERAQRGQEAPPRAGPAPHSTAPGR